MLEIMRTLRSEDGCPWDREQDLRSLKPYLVEECYEVLDAIDGGDRRQLADELGDVLLQVVFQAQICEEEGSFDFEDVVRGLSEKLVRRHPHVFGDAEVTGSDDVLRRWEAIKSVEQGAGRSSAVDGVPRQLPALHKAHRIQKRAARVGFDWTEVHDVLAKLDEEVAEVKEAVRAGRPEDIRAEIGDLLFSAVNLSRFLGHHAEDLLEATVHKFARRFRAMEQAVHASGSTLDACTLEELDTYWEQAKKAEASEA